MPAFVRVDAELPKLSSMKVDKKVLRSDAWQVERRRVATGEDEDLRPLTDDDRARHGAPVDGRDRSLSAPEGGS